MRDRIREVYLTLGRILNNPARFGLGQKTPMALDEALSLARQDLMAELREEPAESDFLATELSQDADCHVGPRVSATSFSLRKTGT